MTQFWERKLFTYPIINWQEEPITHILILRNIYRKGGTSVNREKRYEWNRT